MAAYPPYNVQPNQMYPQQYQQQGYQQPMYQPTIQAYQPPQQTPAIIGRLVSSREEGLAVPADFMGVPTVMLDTSHRCVYTKIFNAQTGAAEFAEYRRIEDKQPEGKTDLENLRETVDQIRKELEELKTGARRRAGRTAVEEDA